jgi:N-acetylneuraminic acid mutarotase
MIKTIALVLVLVFLTASCLIVAKPVSAATASGDLWVERAPMPHEEFSFGAVSANGEICAVGYNFTYVFDPSADAWFSRTPMPTHQRGFAIAAYQGKIYVIGGWSSIDPNTGVAVPTGANEMYDPATDTWTTKAPMPTPTAFLQANVVDDKIYLISGMTNVYYPTLSSAMWIYDPTNDSWSSAAPIPTSVFYYASAVVNNRIYIEGGEQGSSPYYSNLNQIYDPETNTWTLGESLPAPLHQAAAGATTGKLAPAMLYVIGGTNDGYNGVNTTQIYDPQTNNWILGAPMLISRLELAVAVLNDTLYAIGGLSRSGPENNIGAVYAINEQYIPLDYQGPIPSPYVPIPSPSPTQTPTPSPSATPTPSASPSPSPSPSPTATPVKPAPEPFPVGWIVVVAVSVVVVVVAGLLFYFKKRKR